MGADSKHKFRLMVGKRIRLARKEMGLTQEQLAQALAFKDRQILANIEAGKRNVSTEELLTIMKHSGKSLDYFTDPSIVVEHGVFSWRAERDSSTISDYEKKARGIIGAYRDICNLLGEQQDPITTTLNITTHSSYEDAQNAGEYIASKFDLGDVPADSLPAACENKLGIIVLYISAPSEISGAACNLDEIRFILININEPLARQNYDLAHELFHILTWNQLKPEAVDSDKNKRTRAERLADNFSAALLMPSGSLEKHWKAAREEDVTDRINSTAKKMEVSSTAMYWRLKNLGWFSNEEESLIDQGQLKWSDSKQARNLYSKLFMDKLYSVLDRGLLSVRKAASLLDCSVYELADLFNNYDMEPPFEL